MILQQTWHQELITIPSPIANGCTATASAAINAAPEAPVLNAVPTDITCTVSTGSVILSATGGTGPYTYSGDLTTNLAPGTYHYTVTDANGCTATASAAINAAPEAPVLNAVPTDITCTVSTGSVILSATGGTGPYTYSGDLTTNLAPGTYHYTVTDANGCTATASAAISDAGGPTAIASSVTDATCGMANGSLSLGAVTGGLAPFTYSVNESPFTAATTFNNLAAGAQSIDVRDANGCIFSTFTTIK